MRENRERVNSCIDTICQLGCDVVRRTIVAIEQGNTPGQMGRLNSAERTHVLVELKEIMAVYDAEDAGSSQK